MPAPWPLSATTRGFRSSGFSSGRGARGCGWARSAITLNLAPSTLAHHLSTLVAAGLVLQERQGREVFNRVDFPAMRGVLDYLTAECCAGVLRNAAEDAA
jgi:DNA-binding transcriptional ArsR family regulator